MSEKQNKKNTGILTEEEIRIAKEELQASLDELSEMQQRLLAEILNGLNSKLRDEKLD